MRHYMNNGLAKIQRDLELLGLSRDQAKIYLLLVIHKELRIQEIVKLTQMPRSSVYEGLKRLYELGMGSLNSLLGSVLFAIVALLIGLVADSIGPAKTILVLGIASIAVVLIYWNLFRNHLD